MPGAPVTIADVEAAAKRIRGRLHRTPVLTSASLSRETGTRALLKAELFQKAGSFKPRGVLNTLVQLSPEERDRGVIGISAGNHAAALAYGAAAEGLDALVVVWRTASAAKIEAARACGARVDMSAEDIPGAFARLDELLRETGRTLVHPFDDPRVIAGQGTVGLEIAEDVPDADTVLVPTGGGGLVSGMAVAVKARLPHARVVAVEPEGSRALAEGLVAGRPVDVSPVSVADGLNAPFAGANCVALCAKLGVETTTVSEGEIEDAFRFLYRRAKLACEPAGAAAVAALRSGRLHVGTGATVVAVVSGGNVAPETASAILRRP